MEYKGIQGITMEYKRITGYTREYKGIQGKYKENQGDYEGVTGNLQGPILWDTWETIWLGDYMAGRLYGRLPRLPWIIYPDLWFL